MKTRKIKFKFHTGTWTNDDVDITPTLKMCTGSKESETHKVTLKQFGLCWLKWALILEFARIERLYELVEEHECKYCWIMTTEPDDNCYKAPPRCNSCQSELTAEELKNNNTLIQPLGRRLCFKCLDGKPEKKKRPDNSLQKFYSSRRGVGFTTLEFMGGSNYNRPFFIVGLNIGSANDIAYTHKASSEAILISESSLIKSRLPYPALVDHAVIERKLREYEEYIDYLESIKNS